MPLPTLLPGMYYTSQNVSNFLFGSNMPPYYGATENSGNSVANNSTIQNAIKTAGFTLMRVALSNGTYKYTDAEITNRINAVYACGCVPLVILGHGCGWVFNAHVVTMLKTTCFLYEMYNEPDIWPLNLSWQTYLQDWNTNIPQMRAINPSATFGGPVLGAGNGSFGAGAPHPSGYLDNWLIGCVNSGVLPDFITYHVYPCGTQPSSQQCLVNASNISNTVTQCRTVINSIMGTTAGNLMPIGITEWNVDWHSYSGNPSNPGIAPYALNLPANQTFMNQFVANIITSLVNAGCSMACQFDAAMNAAGGADDLVNVGSLQPQIQYAPLKAQIAKYLSGTPTNPPPSPPFTVSPNSITLTATAGGSNPALQNVTLTNTTASSEGWSAFVTNYSSNGGSTNWVTASAGSGTIPGSGNTTVGIGASITGLSAGTYTATVGFTVASTTISITVTLTISPASVINTSVLQVAPSAFSNNPSPIAVTLTNTITAGAGQILTWSATADTGGTTFTPSSGSISAGGQQVVRITLPTISCPGGIAFTFTSPNNFVTSTWTCTGTSAQAPSGSTVAYTGTTATALTNTQLAGRVPGLFGIGTYQSISGGSVYYGGAPLASQSPGMAPLPPFATTSGGTYGYVLDLTIKAPQSVIWTPAPQIGLDGTGTPVVRGYPTMQWQYTEMRPDYWYYLLNMYNLAARQPAPFQYLVLLQFPDSTNGDQPKQMLARMDPPTHSYRQVGAYFGVTLTFTYLGEQQLLSGTPVIEIT